MIATCPACATRYVIDPAALGREGRTVRCAKCRNTWHLTPPEEALAEAEEVARPPRYIPGMEVPPATSAEAGSPSAGREVSADPTAERAGDSGAKQAPHSNLPAVRQSGRRQMVIAWAALGGALVFFLAVLFGLRGPIAGSIPAMAGFYEAVGLGEDRPVVRADEALTAADVLVFTALGLKLESEGGVPVLTVTGRIRNSTGARFALPPVKATLLDADKQAVYSWDFEPPAADIGPEQSLAFAARLSNPPAQVREAVLTFVSDGSAAPDSVGGD